MGNRWGSSGNRERLYFIGLQNHCTWWLQSWNLKVLAPWKNRYDNPRHHIKKQRHYFADKGLSSQSYGFFSSHVWMWEMDHKEGWVLKSWCLGNVVLEKIPMSPLDRKEIKRVNAKGNQSWIFIERTHAEAEAPILWPPDAKSQLTGKDPNARENWGQEEKGETEFEMFGWYHQLNGHEFEQTQGDGEGQGSLACCSPWGCKELTQLSYWTTTKLESNEKPKFPLLFNNTTSVCKNHLFLSLLYVGV